ncbi:MAG: glycosyltransferase [Homoserinimonas sp.]|jgi:glycosyltransferase involved in cell wall biosynthesis|nr:glycosyltransferase [Homoserinimonas sp.]
MPKLSVLLPVFNGAKTIHSAVASTLTALPKDSELVVFNDASTDDTSAVLAQFSDRRLKIIDSAMPVGVVDARNRLLAATDSDLVAPMDADDISFPWRFRQQGGALELQRGVVFTTVVEWRPPRGRVSLHPPVTISSRAFPLHLVLTNPVTHATMMADRLCIDNVGGYRDVPAEDYDLWMRLHLAGVSLRRLSFPSLAYRLHGTQMTASSSWRRSSWANPLVANTYRSLTQNLLGRGYPRLNVLAIDESLSHTDFLSTLADFQNDVAVASNGLSGFERMFVTRVLTARLQQVRALRNSAISQRV